MMKRTSCNCLSGSPSKSSLVSPFVVPFIDVSAPTTTLPRSLDKKRAGLDGSIDGGLASGKTSRYASLVPVAGDGSSLGRADVSR